MTEKPCDLWPGARSKGGYGKRSFRGKTMGAHRAEWIEKVGPIPEGMSVLHRCDNKPCREITHLFLGTQQDNMTDMAKKHRSTFGERNSTTKLTSEQVADIRRKYAEGGHTQLGLAREYGVSKANIYYIVKGLTWTDQHETLIGIAR